MKPITFDQQGGQLQYWKQDYILHLRRYLLYGHENDLAFAREITKYSSQIKRHELLVLHEEMMALMLSHVEMNEAMRMYHRSFVYFTECLSVLASEQVDKGGELVTDHVWREPWLQSNRSFISGQVTHNHYENVLQQMDSAIFLFNENGMLTFINVAAAKLLRVSRKELIGSTLREMLRSSVIALEKRKSILRAYRETMIRRNRFHEFSDKQGHTYLLTCTYGEQMDGDYLFSIKDVSDFKQIEQTAVQNDKLAILGKIAASIAHELRNPLTSIRGFIQLLRPHLMQLGKDEYARIVLAEIDRANDIIYEFLNSSKPSAPFTSKVPPYSLIREVIMLTESEALMRGCEIQLKDQSFDHSLLVAIDVKQIKQVLLNIVRNSVEAICEVRNKRPGLIVIRLDSDSRYVNIRIRDNGKGMDESTLEHLFDPFFTTKQEGTGLGLSVSYRIVRNHNGLIDVNSQYNEWTEFTIRLPIV